MRFNCGPSAAERQSARDYMYQQWHNYFVWWPRRIGNTCAWLETVQRKGRKEPCGYGGPFWYWDFRLLETLK